MATTPSARGVAGLSGLLLCGALLVPSISRAADPAANAYLLIAALLVSGAAGIDDGLEPGPPSDESIGGYDAGASTQRFVALPRSLDEALDALQADDVLADAFDSTLLMRLVDGRRLEAEAFRATVSDWERERYSDEL